MLPIRNPWFCRCYITQYYWDSQTWHQQPSRFYFLIQRLPSRLDTAPYTVSIRPLTVYTLFVKEAPLLTAHCPPGNITAWSSDVAITHRTPTVHSLHTFFRSVISGSRLSTQTPLCCSSEVRDFLNTLYHNFDIKRTHNNWIVEGQEKWLYRLTAFSILKNGIYDRWSTLLSFSLIIRLIDYHIFIGYPIKGDGVFAAQNVMDRLFSCRDQEQKSLTLLGNFVIVRFL